MTLFKGISANYNKKFAICFANNNYNGSTIIENCYPFNIPDEANYVSFYCVGGGGGGFNGTASVGGGGGASGGTASGIVSAKMIPSIVYLITGSGGLGGISGGSSSTAGQNSGVSLYPTTSGTSATVSDSLLIQTAGGNASGSSTGATASNALSAGNTHLSSLLLGLGGASPLIGLSTLAGANHAQNITWPSTVTPAILSGGSGGGDPAASGGQISSRATGNPLWIPNNIVLVAGGLNSSTGAAAGNGQKGITNLFELNNYKPITNPLYSLGGGGGGGNSSTGNGGNGGDGAPGSGGGGGGGSTSGTPGNGGNGGPGFIIIQWW
jgi:hypothetical protein